MAKWLVRLSNGEIVKEAEHVADEKTPWLKLLDKMRVEKLWITEISIVSEGHRFNLPSEKGSPHFSEFAPSNPESFYCYRRLGIEQAGLAEQFLVIGARYPSYYLEVWVSETDSQHSWSLVKPV